MTVLWNRTRLAQARQSQKPHKTNPRKGRDMHRTTIALLTILILCASGSIDARECDTKLDGFRLELDEFLADFYKAADLAKQMDYPAAADFEGAVDGLSDSIEHVKNEELLELCLLFDRTPSLVEMPILLEDAMRMADFGQDWLPCLPPAAQFALASLVLRAKLGATVGETACDFIGCFDISGVGCSVVCAIAGVARTVEIVIDGALTLNEHACLREHFDDLAVAKTDLENVSSNVLAIQRGIDQNLDVAMSTRTSQTSIDGVALQLSDLGATLGNPRTTTITDDIVAINADLADQKADREAYQSLKFRLTIEFQLIQGASGQIASFRLPNSFGGYLEEVRETVATAITMHINAGQSINNAMHYFNLADDQFDDESYGLAFGNYRLAYRQAVMLKAGD